MSEDGSKLEAKVAATVPVPLGDRSYEIVIEPDLLAQAADRLGPIIDGRRVAVVTDETVAGRYLPEFEKTLAALGVEWHSFVIEGGEQAKSFGGLEGLLDRMLEAGIDRRCLLIAFGGGVVGDVSGFAAALFMRGIDLIQVPTTFMAQVDSAVGGKNAINMRQGKNLVGSFLQPLIVLNDVSLLASLPPGEMRSGYGEIIKYGMLRGETWFKWLEDNVGRLLDHDPEILVEAVRMGCETKAQIVSEDERDFGKRALVNLGHTFAHAFEAQAGYGHVLHGHAVAVGLIAAADLSERIGACSPGLSERVREHVRRAGMYPDLPSLSQAIDWRASAIHTTMGHDKKTFAGKINFVLLNELGDPFVSAEVPRSAVIETLEMLGARLD